MACHYQERGHTRAVVGASYSSSLRLAHWWRLKHVDTRTECCHLVGLGPYSSGELFVSLTTLSHWHRAQETGRQ